MQCELKNNVTNLSTVFQLWKREEMIKSSDGQYNLA